MKGSPVHGCRQHRRRELERAEQVPQRARKGLPLARARQLDRAPAQIVRNLVGLEHEEEAIRLPSSHDLGVQLRCEVPETGQSEGESEHEPEGMRDDSGEGEREHGHGSRQVADAQRHG